MRHVTRLLIALLVSTLGLTAAWAGTETERSEVKTGPTAQRDVAVPRATCHEKDRRERGMQGRVSFRKRKVIQELFRVLKPGGRLSITDIVSAKALSQSIVNDPKLWAS